MANNIIQVKRTSVSGRAANTTTLPNAGEIAINMTDKIMYSTNGTVVFEIGANNTNVNVTGNATIKAIVANGSLGTAGQMLTSNGTVVYWSTPSGGGSVNVNSTYTWTNIHVFANNLRLYDPSDPVVNTQISFGDIYIRNDIASAYLNHAGITIAANGDVSSALLQDKLQILHPTAGVNLQGAGAYLQVSHPAGNGVVIDTGNVSLSNVFLYVDGSSGNTGQFLTSGGSSPPYWSNAPTPTVNVNANYSWTNAHTFSGNVTVGRLIANGGTGTSGQFLTSNGTSTYWSTASGGGGSVNTSATYVWTNNHTWNTGGGNTNISGFGLDIINNSGVLTLTGSDVFFEVGSSNNSMRYDTLGSAVGTLTLSNVAIAVGEGGNTLSTGLAGQYLTSNASGHAYWSSVEKSLTIEDPQANDKIMLGYAVHPKEFLGCISVLSGNSSPQVEFDILYDTIASSNGTSMLGNTTFCTNTTLGDFGFFSSPVIPQFNFYWLYISSVSGNVNSLHVTIL